MTDSESKGRNLVLRISYDGVDNVIWRKVLVDSNMRLNELAYLILATFDTMAMHLYIIHTSDEMFSEGNWDGFEGRNARKTRLSDLQLMRDDTMVLEYDMGVGHQFNISVVGVKSCKDETETPYILDGNGCGIIEEEDAMTLAFYIDQIDMVGKTVKPIYYKDRSEPWDYRKTDVASMNKILKFEMKKVAKAYGMK